jgi:hypothetical protein
VAQAFSQFYTCIDVSWRGREGISMNSTEAQKTAKTWPIRAQYFWTFEAHDLSIIYPGPE